MKRYGNLFDKICSMDNLYLAHQNARKGKTHDKLVQLVDSDPDFYLSQIRDMLINKTYKVSKYRYKLIVDKGKERNLMILPYYPDRIIQWAIMLQLELIFDSVIPYHSCASLTNRGISRVVNLMHKYLKDKENTQYCLKLDIKKFYQSIDQSILKQKLRTKFKDKNLLELLDLIIDSYDMYEGKGVPIGSYLSQYFSNFYLSKFDHYCKESLKIKYVIRYMDDIVILASNKEILHFYLEVIRDNIRYVELELKDNYQIFPTDVRGVDFVGYRFFHDYTLLRKSTSKRFKKLSNKIKKRERILDYSEYCSINSYKGWLIPCNSYNLESVYINSIESYIDNFNTKEVFNEIL